MSRVARLPFNSKVVRFDPIQTDDLGTHRLTSSRKMVRDQFRRIQMILYPCSGPKADLTLCVHRCSAARMPRALLAADVPACLRQNTSRHGVLLSRLIEDHPIF